MRIILPRGILRDERLEACERERLGAEHELRVAGRQLDAGARVLQRFGEFFGREAGVDFHACGRAESCPDLPWVV